MKIYTSILSLLPDIRDYLIRKDRYLTAAIFTNNTTQMGGPLFQIVPDEEGTRTITLLRPIFNFSVGTVLNRMPYLAETELFRTSDFGFGEEELDCLEQMALLHVFNWFDTQSTYYSMITRLYEELEAEGKLWFEETEGELDLQEILRNAYKKFKPMERSYTSYQTKHYRSWYAAPVSSWDALDTLKTLYGPKGSSAYGWVVAGHTLLFLPLLITFHLMERETKTFQSFTWSDYNEYREGLPNLLSSGIAYREQLKITDPGTNFSYGNVNFSYGNVVGHYAEGADRYQADDKLFAAKVLGHIFHKMQELAVERNVTTVSTDNLGPLRNEELVRVNMLLNKSKLNWTKEDS